MAARRSPPRKGSQNTKRPTATLDLKAKEIKSDAPATSTPSSAASAAEKSSAAPTKPSSAAATASSGATARASSVPPTGGAAQATAAKSGANVQSGAASGSPSQGAAAATPKAQATASKPTDKPTTTSGTETAKPASSGFPKAGSQASSDRSDAGKSSGGFKKTTTASTSRGSDAGKSSTQGETQSTSAEMPPPQRSGGGGGGFLSHAAAGLLGAVAVLFGAPHVPGIQALVAPGGVSSEADPAATAAVEQLTSRIGALETQLGEVASTEPGNGAAAVDLAPLEARLAALEAAPVSDGTAGAAVDPAALDELKSAQAALSARADELTAQLAQAIEASDSATAVPDDVTSRLTALETTLSDIATAAETGDATSDVAQLTALTGKINDFGSEIDTKISALRQSVTERFETASQVNRTQLEELQAREAQRAEALETLRAGDRRLGIELEAAKTRSGELGEQIAKVETGIGELQTALEATGANISAVKSSVAAATASVADQLTAYAKGDDLESAIQPVMATLDSVKTDLDGVVSREQTRQQSTREIVLALELANLRRTMERGEPIGPALQRVKAFAPAELDLSALEANASGQVPTAAELANSFRPAARAALDAEQAPTSDNVFDQLLSGASSIVRVRRTGDIEGDTTEAIIARIEQRLEAGDLKGAAEQAGTLSGKAAVAASGWVEQLNARVAVDLAMGTIEDRLKQSLAGPATQ